MVNTICRPKDPTAKKNETRKIFLKTKLPIIPIILTKAPTKINLFLPKKSPKMAINTCATTVPRNIIKIELFNIFAESVQR